MENGDFGVFELLVDEFPDFELRQSDDDKVSVTAELIEEISKNVNPEGVATK